MHHTTSVHHDFTASLPDFLVAFPFAADLIALLVFLATPPLTAEGPLASPLGPAIDGVLFGFVGFLFLTGAPVEPLPLLATGV